MSKHLLELKDVSKYYYKEEIVTLGLRKIDLTLDTGEFVAVIGESGSGKTTLMNVISGVDTYEEGEMYYKGEETSCFTPLEWDSYRMDNVSFIFQEYNLIDSYSVLQNVELALINICPDKDKRRKRALELIEKVELTSHIKHKCTMLSGGQKQRVAIARALAKDSPIIIADEPTGNLDEETSKSIIKLLNDVSKDKLLVMVTHNYDDVSEYATRKVRLFDGGIIEDKVVRDYKTERERDIIIVKDREYIEFTKSQKRRKHIRSLFQISAANVIATPRKSIFLFFTVFLAVVLFVVYMLCSSALLLMPPETNYNGDRKDTAIVYKSDRQELTTAEEAKITDIAGIEAAMVYYNMYTNSLTETMPSVSSIFFGNRDLQVLNLASFNKKQLEYGTLPEDDNEILLSFYDRQEPKLNLIGTTQTFTYNCYSNSYGSSYSSVKSFAITKDYKITGFTAASDNYCYLTTNAIDSLSREYDEMYVENKMFSLFSRDIFPSLSEQFTLDDIILDDSVPQGEIILIYDDTAVYSHSALYYDFYNYFTSEDREDTACYIFRGYEYIQENNPDIMFKISTPSENSEYYDNFYEDKITIALNPIDFSYSMEDGLKSNSATVVFDEFYNIDSTISRLKDAGYKVVYLYASPMDIYQIEMLLVYLIMSIVIGIVMIGIGIIFISQIFGRVMNSKKKDYSIMRTLGISSGSIKSITYLEFMLISLFAYLSVILIIIAVYLIALVSKSYKVINMIMLVLPYGVFHYKTLNIFIIVLIMIVIQSIFIIRRFLKKLMKDSIKKSSVGGAL